MARNKEKMSVVLSLKGLDLFNSNDLIADGRTPYSKNFRLYAQQTDDRRVAVSSRKGPGYYTKVLGEYMSNSCLSDVSADTATVGIIKGIHAQSFRATQGERLIRVELKVSDPDASASGPLLVEIYDDKNNRPNRLLSESSILGGEIGRSSKWLSARFIKAAQLERGEQYWIVVRMQDDCKGEYSLDTTSSGEPAYMTNSSLSSATEQPYSLNYKVFTASSGAVKGAYRFTRDNGQNITMAVFGTTMYKIDEATGTFAPILGGLSSAATEYRFTNGDNKVFWVNGYDQLTSWNGTDESSSPNKIINPDFELNTNSWTPQPGTAISRVTTEHYSGVASVQLTAGSGVRQMNQTTALEKNRRYRVSFWAKGSVASGNVQIAVNGTPSPVVESTKPLTTDWVENKFYWTPGDDITTISIQSTDADVFIDSVSVVDTGIEYIIDTELPILSDILMHKDRLWGVVASDPNKLVFSENPGNPAYDPTGVNPTKTREQWYYAWLSVSYWYVPRPHNGSPITALVSFQDALTVFTQDNKYILSGYDRGSLSLRQSTGSKGAISQRGVVRDENRIYFVSDDGLYEYNGSADTKISGLVDPLIDGCPSLINISPVVWKNQVRFYMASEGSPVNDICLIYDKDVKELLLDTDTYISQAVYYNDADDDHQLIEFSSLVPVAYRAEQSYHSLGAPIDFEYRLKYDSMGTPMQRKRIKRFYPILQGVDSTFRVQLAMDKDFEDSPKIKEQLLATNGAKLGEFKLGDGTLLGGNKSFKPKRQSYSGYARYWQLRVKRKGVMNRVAFIGAQFSYKVKRL